MAAGARPRPCENGPWPMSKRLRDVRPPPRHSVGSAVLPEEVSLTPTSQPLQRLHQLESGTATEAALAFFDSLPPVEIATMIGSWRGTGVETGHPARTVRLARQAIYDRSHP